VAKTASAIVTISNRLGLHARPAMLFVQTAANWQSDITVRRTDQQESVDGKSIMQMMMLAATQGTALEVQAIGDDADQAIKELVALIKSNFNDD
jgi:phosphotransferase system HPr (HPr) family protein